jgi:CDP-diacylglycerol---serine O-phosphatidyltransferase
MSIKSHIPNLLTLGNLACGVACIVILFNPWMCGWPLAIPVLFVAALVFDFFDGFVARLLKVNSPLGKELDSLADMVTFGVLPGMLVFHIIRSHPAFYNHFQIYGTGFSFMSHVVPWMFIFIPILSGLRLAKFNIDTRQTTGFIGLPTPANSIFFFALFLWADSLSENAMGLRDVGLFAGFSNSESIQSIGYFFIHPYTLSALSVIFAYLLVSPIPLMALKFKNFTLKDNLFKYILLVSAAVLLILFTFRGVPFLILLYFALSIAENLTHRKDEVHR